MKFEVESGKREEIVDITGEVKNLVEGKEGGACLVYVPHATCGIIVNENYDEKVCRDILRFLKDKIPQGEWEHDKIDNNADSHIKSSIIGPQELIPMENGRVKLGRWQGIGLAEFDGPRKRTVIVKIL
jgi:secondary thiamine-phosphate synthase enzyme